MSIDALGFARMLTGKTGHDLTTDVDAETLVRWAIEEYGPRFAVVTSFQSEGMIVLDMAVRISPEVRVITLDTGHLPPETYEIMNSVRNRYGIPIEVVVPDPTEVQEMVTRFGLNLFRNSVAERRLCCEVRKVRPLTRKLTDVSAYAVGLRRGQGDSRTDVPKIGEDSGRLKLSPVADWTREQVLAYTREHDLPVHPLYSAGYTSIGCAPCTRPTVSGEAERAGRWWWETDGNGECGLHFTADGRIERSVDVLLREILTK